MNDNKVNSDDNVVRGFGDEWSRLDQSALSAVDSKKIFDNYFHVFPWHCIDDTSEGFDLGCGSGRWALHIAPLVGRLNCIDASNEALSVAKKLLAPVSNCRFYHASVDAIPLEDASQDFGYSLGVLHHVPDTLSALKDCALKLKPGAPFLLYCYYAFDNRPAWFRAVWRMTDPVRSIVSRSPLLVRYYLSQFIAAFIYYPLARLSWLLDKAGIDVSNIPLSYYKNRSYFVMRTDALDRFGTRIEHRFTRDQLQSMMQHSGFENIVISDIAPYWCVVGFRSK